MVAAKVLSLLCLASALAALGLAVDGWLKTQLWGIALVHLKAIPVPLGLSYALWVMER